MWNGVTWAPATLTGGGTVTSVTGTAPVSVATGTTTPLISITSGGITSTLLASNSVDASKISDASITAADLSSMSATSGQVLTFNGTVWSPATPVAGLSTTLTSANIYIGNGSNVATALVLNGDAALTNTGLLTIAGNAITSAKIADGTIAAADLNSMSATSGQVLTFNGTAWAPATSVTGLSSTLPSANIYVGNGSNVGTAVALSGDATLSNTGILTIANSAINSAKIADGSITSTDITDATITATDLASMSATSGQVLTFNGTTWAPATTVAGLSTTLTSGNIYVGSSGNMATSVAVSGDATINNSGTLTIANNSINTAKIADGSVTSADISDGAIAAADLSSMSANSGQVLTFNGTAWAPATNTDLSSTLTSANIFVGNGSNVATGVAMGGDATISTGGALTIVNNAINSAKIADGSVASADLATNINISTTGNLVTTGTGTLNVAGASTLSGTLNVSGATTLTTLTGVGTRMVVANTAGVLSTQLLPVTVTQGDLTSTTIGVSITGGTNAVNGAAGTTVNIQNATTGQPGLLTAADFTTFNNKLDGSSAAGGDVTGTLSNLQIGSGAVTTTEIAAGTIVDSNISGTAAIAGSKIIPAFGTQNISTTGTLASGAATVSGLTVSGTSTTINTVPYTWPGTQGVATSVLTNNGSGALNWAGLGTLASLSAVSGGSGGTITDATIDNNDVSATAAIAGTKISPNFGSQTVTTTGPTSTGALNASGTITYSALAGTGNRLTSVNATGIVGTVATGTGVLTNDGSGNLTWGPAGLSSALTSANIFVGNGSNVATGVAMSGDATISNAGALTIGTGAINSTKILDGTIADVDVSNTAAIAGSKITPAFGTQNISTTGTLSSGATTVTGLTIGTSVWPANVSGVLTNNGAGILSWGTTFVNPMTTTGDIIFGGAAGVATRLAGTAGFLKSTGVVAPT